MKHFPLLYTALPITLLLLLTSFQDLHARQYTFVTFQYPPLEFTNDGVKAEGGVVEIVRKVMDNLGHSVTIKPFPWTRALKMVQNGEADAIFTAYKNLEREKFLDYSNEVLFPQSVYFYKKKGSNAFFSGDFSELRTKNIGVVSTISYGRVFGGYKSLLRLDRANNLEQSFMKLVKGRVDLVPSDSNVADYTLRKLGMEEDVERLDTKIESVPSYIAFSKVLGLDELRDSFDKELRNLKQNGEYNNILKRNGIVPD